MLLTLASNIECRCGENLTSAFGSQFGFLFEMQQKNGMKFIKRADKLYNRHWFMFYHHISSLSLSSCVYVSSHMRALRAKECRFCCYMKRMTILPIIILCFWCFLRKPMHIVQKNDIVRGYLVGQHSRTAHDDGSHAFDTSATLRVVGVDRLFEK